MRTTINISEQVYREAKARAATTSQTVSQVIEDAVREALRVKSKGSQATVPLPVFGGSGVLPGVDLGDSGALLDAMELGAGPDAMR